MPWTFFLGASFVLGLGPVGRDGCYDVVADVIGAGHRVWCTRKVSIGRYGIQLRENRRGSRQQLNPTLAAMARTSQRNQPGYLGRECFGKVAGRSETSNCAAA